MMLTLASIKSQFDPLEAHRCFQAEGMRKMGRYVHVCVSNKEATLLSCIPKLCTQVVSSNNMRAWLKGALLTAKDLTK